MHRRFIEAIKSCIITLLSLAECSVSLPCMFRITCAAGRSTLPPSMFSPLI
ncbi:hypothetical protein KC19_1G302800 [Ceratodon purpureus]|uniref:Uncharacterized protein n=1 Tax=Ceratodon purpureus TaxID=3225 RepID=A0A8T0JDC3_CERPU|nr:hypothetical protein KC19_1G302800 [Ceratodon purpureus]